MMEEVSLEQSKGKERSIPTGGSSSAPGTPNPTQRVVESLVASSSLAASSSSFVEDHDDDDSTASEQDLLMMPLIGADSDKSNTNNSKASPQVVEGSIRSRKQATGSRQNGSGSKKKTRRKRPSIGEDDRRRWCPAPFVRSTISVMNFLARVLFWSSVVGMIAAVFWYSHELKNNGTDPHLIAWFSAGAFVLLGFPISMYGIVMHLANYNQPNIQIYIVRILWMVPIYSMESWLCLRFHKWAIYIETLRDVYESYVLYSFLQYLIQVLGGEEELILMLKDKSPTRGVHMWGLQWCVRPWLMGQPVSRTIYPGGNTQNARPVKKIQWTSPFFVRCKFGVLQYVILKFVSSIIVMLLEVNEFYNEGDFSPTSGYLYICILTNLSQCWALYCLIFFYFATVNELSPIRPVGKFLSVKAIVFFTWWQSVCISFVYQMDLIPHYHASSESEWTSEDVAKGLQDYLICIEMFLASIVHVFVFPHTDYLPQAIQARRQSTHPSMAMTRRLGRLHNRNQYGWLYSGGDDRSMASKNSNNGTQYDLELASQTTDGSLEQPRDHESSLTGEGLLSGTMSPSRIDEEGSVDEDVDLSAVVSTTGSADHSDAASADHSIPEYSDDDGEELDIDATPIAAPRKTGFFGALLESTIPRDVIDQSVGIVKGDYNVEKKTLLHHAATSDQYELFSHLNQFKKISKTAKEQD